MEKYDCGINAYIDYDNQREIEDKVAEALNSKRLVDIQQLFRESLNLLF